MSAPALVTIPSPAPELVRVRLIHGIITCPRCARKVFHVRMRSGEAWLPCNHERLERRGSCAARWLNLTLPAGSIGSDLTRLTDRPTAFALIRLVFPHLVHATDAQCELVALASGIAEDRHAPSHIQIVVRGRDEHLHRWDSVGQILRAMELV